MPAGYGQSACKFVREPGLDVTPCFMYFQVMSVSTEERVIALAILACDRLILRLGDVIAEHEHAAGVARPEWSGPHRDAFDDRVAALHRDLDAGRTWALRTRHEAELRLAQVRAETEMLRMTGVR